jgi:hypothetical protein
LNPFSYEVRQCSRMIDANEVRDWSMSSR